MAGSSASPSRAFPRPREPGWGSRTESGGEGTLYHFHVDPDRWRAGIGTALHAACVEAWRNAPVTVARLEVFEPNQRARAFYARQGRREDGRAGDHIMMVLPLPGRAGQSRAGER